MLRSKRASTPREPTIALINVIFLMLIFFMVAGTIAKPMDGEVRLVSTPESDGRVPDNALAITADGTLRHSGAPIDSIAAFIANLPEDARETVRLVPDRELPATRLVSLAKAARESGAKRVMIVTERGLE